jgi:KDO2-lipid IV(A) lauroyltransferase
LATATDNEGTAKTAVTGVSMGHLGVLLARCMIFVVGFLPLRFWHAMIRPVADLVFFVGFKRSTITANLEHVFGDTKTAAEKKHIAREANRNLFYMLIECLRASNRSQIEKSAARVTFDDMPLIDSCDVDPRGVIFAVCHSGNFDMPAVWWTQFKNRPLGVVMKSLENPPLNDLLVSLRRDLYGFIVINAKGKQAVEEINAHMQAGYHLCILPDQNARKRGVMVDFLGKPASTYKGCARTYMVNQEMTRLIVAVPTRIDGGMNEIVYIREIDDFVPTGDNDADVFELTQRISTVSSEIILANPESYLWHHRRWGHAPWQKAPEPVDVPESAAEPA